MGLRNNVLPSLKMGDVDPEMGDGDPEMLTCQILMVNPGSEVATIMAQTFGTTFINCSPVASQAK